MVKKKDSTYILFGLCVVLFFSVLSLLFVISEFNLSSNTGVAFTQTSATESQIMQFLKVLKEQPSKYVVVYGQSANDYEKNYAKKIADTFGIKAISENAVTTEERFIVVGNSVTNNIILLYLDNPMIGDETIWVTGNTLYFIVETEPQAKNLFDKLLGINSKVIPSYSEKISPKNSIFNNLTSMFIFAVILSVVFIFLFDRYRKMNLSKNEEPLKEKVESLTDYIHKYRKLGYPEDNLKDWLQKQGFDESLITNAIEAEDNVRKDISD